MSGRSKQSDRETVEQFRNVTSSSEKVAREFLAKHKWKLDAAVDAYFNAPPPPQPQAAHSKSNASLYEKYKEIGVKEGGDKSVDAIQGDGIAALAKDLGLEMTDILVMVLCWKMEAKVAFQISRTEFMDCLANSSVESVAQLKAKLPQWKNELNDNKKFKSFYVFCFEYSKLPESKTLTPDIALSLWKLILPGKYKHLNAWCDFVEKKFGKAISRDTWTQFFDFTQNVAADLSNFDDDGAWPVVIDDFVTYLKPTLKR